MKFLNILSSEQGYNLSLRHLSLSTCGLVDRIYELAAHKSGLTLSISLHAPNDEIRSRTMPINNRYPIDELLKACRYYFQQTGRRISFEYALIEGVNDEICHANELADRLKGMAAHVNLIPVNPVKERGFKRGSRQRIEAFQKTLEKRGSMRPSVGSWERTSTQPADSCAESMTSRADRSGRRKKSDQIYGCDRHRTAAASEPGCLHLPQGRGADRICHRL